MENFFHEVLKFYRQDWLLFALGVTVFGALGFGGERLTRFLFFYGNKKQSAANEVQAAGLRGFARFFFWIIMIELGFGALVFLASSLWRIAQNL